MHHLNINQGPSVLMKCQESTELGTVNQPEDMTAGIVGEVDIMPVTVFAKGTTIGNGDCHYPTVTQEDVRTGMGTGGHQMEKEVRYKGILIKLATFMSGNGDCQGQDSPPTGRLTHP